MKFKVSKEQLDRQLGYVSRVVTSRNSLPVLSNVLLETDKDLLRITGTDLDLTLTTHIPAEISQEGTFTVPAELFQEFVHQNPDEEIGFKLESFELIGTSTKVTARISGIDAEEFPSLPKLEQGTVIRLPLQELVGALKQVVIACALDSSRPVLTAVYFSVVEDTLTLAATDSFRLVEKKISIVPVQTDLTLLVPMRTIQEIIRIGSSLPQVLEVELEIAEQQLLFRVGSLELFSRLISGNFPKYGPIIPTSFVAVADVTTSELVQALRLSTVFSQSGLTNVMLEVGEEGTLSLVSYGSKRGTTKHMVYAILQEGFAPLKAAFNARFLLVACSACDSPHLQLRFSGTTSPLVLSTQDSTYIQLVMPIRLDT